MRTTNALHASTTAYSVEGYFDYLTLDGTTYRSGSGPSNVFLASDTEVRWYTDGSVVRSGWVLCGQLAMPPPPSPPEVPPTPPNMPPVLPPLPPPAIPFGSAILFDFETSTSPGWTTGPTAFAGTHPFARRAYGTPSYSTGPTSGYGGRGYYYYAETSSPRRQGDVFTLAYDGSACTSSGGVVTAVSFYFHKYGATMGTMDLKRADGMSVWTRSGNMGNVWLPASATLNSPSFHFEYTRGASYTGDASIDHVTVICGFAPPSWPPSPPSPAPTAPPPAPPPTYPIPPATWSVTSGASHCQISPDGRCVTDGVGYCASPTSPASFHIVA